MTALVGIIGGSGLSQMEALKIDEERFVETPFGAPSDAVMLGSLAGRKVAFIPRHGRGHRIPPHQINYRANIYALKTLGVEQIISVSAVGSLREDMPPGDIVVVDQFVDRTKQRCETFFEDGIVGHVSFADPVCKYLRKHIIETARKLNLKHHEKGTYICIEGPMFSSKAESEMYRKWGMDIIGMTNYQEAKLALEAEISYATIALVTDYDCWHPSHEHVDVSMVVSTMKKNVANVQQLFMEMIPNLPSYPDAPARNILQYAIQIEPSKITADAKKRLAPIIGKYFPL